MKNPRKYADKKVRGKHNQTWHTAVSQHCQNVLSFMKQKHIKEPLNNAVQLQIVMKVYSYEIQCMCYCPNYVIYGCWKQPGMLIKLP